MTYYAVCNASGPISVELEGDSEETALAAFARLDRRAIIDDASTDAEDALGIEGADMSESEFAAALKTAGARHVRALGEVDRHGRSIAGDWQLWVTDLTLELVRSDLGDGGWSIHLRRPGIDEGEDPARAWPIAMSGESDRAADGGWARPTPEDWQDARRRASALARGWR